MKTSDLSHSRSPRFRDLEQELSTLRDHFLPTAFSPTGDYDEQVYSHTVAYRMLAHAAFEAYVEDRVRELCLLAVKEWDKAGRVTKAVACLIAFSDQPMEKPPATIVPTQPTKQTSWHEISKLSGKITRVVRSFHSVVDRNNGIKEENLLRLLLPIGVEADELDNSWVADLNSFADARGKAAHTSTLNITRQLPDPKDEYTLVQQLLGGFGRLDELLETLKP